MDPIIREFPFELRASESNDGLTLEGYAAVFDSPTRITGWEGDFEETIARGAFKKTLSERTPVLMFNHGRHPLVGDMPIGAFTTLREDEHGLFVRARLADNWLNEPVRDAIANGSISGMSFRFEPVQEKWNPSRTERRLLEVRMPELGPVTFPAYAETSVGVRDQAPPDIARLRGDLAFLLSRSAEEIEALTAEAVTPEVDTESAEPPARQEPEPVEETTPHQSRLDRQRAIAKLKGIIE